MDLKRVAALIGLLCLGNAAQAADAMLPSLAADPPPPPSIWKGLYVGSEIFAGSSGHKGFVGGDAFAGYDHVFSNNVLLGVQGSVGYSPVAIGPSFARGAEFATLDAKVGYAMGRWTPYMTTGVILAKPNYGFGAVPGLSTSDSINALFGSPGSLEAAPRVGAGVDYAITPDLSVGVGVQVGRGAATLFP